MRVNVTVIVSENDQGGVIVLHELVVVVVPVARVKYMV